MSDTAPSATRNAQRIAAGLRRRHRAERRFRAFGLGAILISALALALLLVTMTANGLGGYTRTEMRFPLDLLFLDRAGTVLKAAPDVRPWRIRGAWRGFAVVELAAGALAASGARRGDTVEVRTIV